MTITLLFIFRSEYGAFWKCVQAGGIYVFTQLCKMLILATFFPANDVSGQEGMDFVGVWNNMKNKINLIPCIGNGPG